MSRTARPSGFGARMQALRKALGRRGDETSMRGFARELGMSPQGYRYWENPGSYPGHSKLTNALASVASVKARGLDPGRLAIWLETGEGPEPWLASSTQPTSGGTSSVDIKSAISGEIDHRTPWKVIVALRDLTKHGLRDQVDNILDILGPIAEGVLGRDLPRPKP
jgi:transcriptional regulator with XRE-family HTH domain